MDRSILIVTAVFSACGTLGLQDSRHSMAGEAFLDELVGEWKLEQFHAGLRIDKKMAPLFSVGKFDREHFSFRLRYLPEHGTGREFSDLKCTFSNINVKNNTFRITCVGPVQTITMWGKLTGETLYFAYPLEDPEQIPQHFEPAEYVLFFTWRRRQ